MRLIRLLRILIVLTVIFVGYLALRIAWPITMDYARALRAPTICPLGAKIAIDLACQAE